MPMTQSFAVQQKILLLDDEQDFLDVYKEMLAQHLSSLPEVRVALTGSRALSMLESEKYQDYEATRLVLHARENIAQRIERGDMARIAAKEKPTDPPTR